MKYILFPHTTETIWVTAAGIRTPIKDMDDDHLRNTINMLRRKVDWYKDYLINFNNLSDAAARRLEDMDEDLFLKKQVRPFRALLREAHKRGFTRNVTVEVPF